MPYEEDSPARDSKSTLREKKSKETYGRIPIVLDNSPVPSKPMLDVEIPQITMERYSVMFGSVLQSQPTLLTRRQAAVQKLKNVEGTVDKEEVRQT